MLGCHSCHSKSAFIFGLFFISDGKSITYEGQAWAPLVKKISLGKNQRINSTNPCLWHPVALPYQGTWCSLSRHIKETAWFCSTAVTPFCLFFQIAVLLTLLLSSDLHESGFLMWMLNPVLALQCLSKTAVPSQSMISPIHGESTCWSREEWSVLNKTSPMWTSFAL